MLLLAVIGLLLLGLPAFLWLASDSKHRENAQRRIVDEHYSDLSYMRSPRNVSRVQRIELFDQDAMP